MPATARVPARREWDTLTPATRRLLFLLRRFGFLTAPQAARLDHRKPRGGVSHEITALRKLGLLRTLRPAAWRGQRKIYTLAAGADDFVRGLPDVPPYTRALLDRVDEIVAAVDVALELEGQGEGRWWTWAEHRRAHPPGVVGRGRERRAPILPPSGVLEGADGLLRPVWVLLTPRTPGVLYRSMRAVCPSNTLTFGKVYAPPEMCEGLRQASLPGSIVPWTAPHLAGRHPLLPGWWQVASAGQSQDRNPRRRHPRANSRVSDRPSLGPLALAILAHLDRFGHATARQIGRALPCHISRAQRVLTRLRRQGLAQSHSQGHKQPMAWSATRAGLAMIGSRGLPVPREPLHRRHTLALGDLADELTRRTGGTWETEREVRGELYRADPEQPPAPPDGRLTLPDGTRICIQLQLSLGGASRQLREAWPLYARQHCTEVWFLCDPDVAPAYRRALRPAEVGFIKVTEWVAPDHSARFRETQPCDRKKPGNGADPGAV